MFSLIYKIPAFLVFTFLKITVAFTNNMHSMVLDICGIIGDTVRSNAGYELTSSQNIPQIDFTTQTDSDILNVSACTQTEERFTQSINETHGRNSSTDVFIYNLDTSKRVTITHKDLNLSFTKAKYNQCGSCKSQGKRFLRRVKSDSVNRRTVGKSQSNSSACSSRYKQESESSNMSIENDVTNTKIMQYSPNTTFTKRENIHDRFHQSSSDQHFENIQENDYPCGVDECSEFEHFDENFPMIIYEGDGKSISDKQKTSSPIEKSSQVLGIDPHTQLGNLSRNQQNDEFGDTENIDSSSDTSDEFQTLGGDGIGSKSFPNILDNTVLLNNSVKRRLSLTSNLSTANEAANFRKIQNQIIENTIKSTPRHESVKVVKYPFSPEIDRPDEKKENSKEMLSCSSYESLPVSDHIRNTIEKNTLFSLYKENFLSASSPDFSSVDDFVEAFQKIKKALSVSEIVETHANFPFPEDSRNEVKRLLRAHSCCIIGTQQSQTNENNEMIYEDEQNKYTSNDNCSRIQPSKPAATDSLESSWPELISPSSLKAVSTASTSHDENLDERVAEQIKSLFFEIVENIDSYDKFKIKEEFNGADNMQSDFGFTSKDHHLGQSKTNEYEFGSTLRDTTNWKLQTQYKVDDESFDSSRNQRTESKSKPAVANETKQATVSAHCKAEKENAKEKKNEMNCSGRHKAYARKSFAGSRKIETNKNRIKTETNKNRIKTELSNTNQTTEIFKSETPNDLLNVANKSNSEMLLLIYPEVKEHEPNQFDRLTDEENDSSVLTILDRSSVTVKETAGREKFDSFKCNDDQRCDMQLENNVEQIFLENGQLSTLVEANTSCEDTSSDNSALTVKDFYERSSDT